MKSIHPSYPLNLWFICQTFSCSWLWFQNDCFQYLIILISFLNPSMYISKILFLVSNFESLIFRVFSLTKIDHLEKFSRVEDQSNFLTSPGLFQFGLPSVSKIESMFCLAKKRLSLFFLKKTKCLCKNLDQSEKMTKSFSLN